MLPRHALLRAAAAVALLVPAACMESAYTGDPGPSFLTGTAGTGSTGQAGTYGSGAAGTHATGAAGSTGAAGTGAATQACTVGATGTFTMTWTIEDGAGVASTCDAVAATTVDIAIVSMLTGAASQSTVPCAALSATTCALPQGYYSVSMKLRADATTLAEIVAPQLYVVDGVATPIASLPFRVGGPDAAMGRGLAATWTIGDDVTEAPLTCADTAAAKVRLTAGTKTFDFPCADGKGRTTALAPGDYPVKLRLIDAQEGDISVTQLMTIKVGAGQLVFLGDVFFGVVP